jgi:hypothetical protein
MSAGMTGARSSGAIMTATDPRVASSGGVAVGSSQQATSAAPNTTSNSSNGSSNSNSLSYGALKNRFLSGTKNKSKLFTLGSR